MPDTETVTARMWEDLVTARIREELVTAYRMGPSPYLPNPDSVFIPVPSTGSVVESEERFSTCGNCSRTITPGEAIRVTDGVTNRINACSHCTFECEECETRHMRYDEHQVYSTVNRNEVTRVCPDCCWTCRDCGNYFSNSVADNNDRCDRCNDNMVICDVCEVDMHIDNDYGEDDRHMCRSCHNAERAEGPLFDYSYKPTPKLFKRLGESSRLYLGWELEVDHAGSPDIIEDIKSLHLGEEFYCKEDGSLANGFEIVSHPATYDYWRETNLSFMQALKWKKYRSYNTTTCGFHVHVSKAALTKLDQLKLMQFFKANQEFIAKLSRRKMSSLDRWARIDQRDAKALVHKVKRGYSEQRYEAINIEPRNTVEFRIFRGTLEENGLRRNLAFVYSLCQFVKGHWMREMDKFRYIEYLKTSGVPLLGEATSLDLVKWLERL